MKRLWLISFLVTMKEYGKKTGDFKVNERCILEVGSKGKTYDQIADVPDSYILAGGIDTPYRRK